MSTVTLDIDSLASGGDGVARHDGLVVFTPRTAPGDRVKVEVTVTGRVGRGQLLQIERAGGTRVEARCSHYAAPDRCGGCQWQHVDLAAQREAKRTMVRDAFARIAKRDVALPPIHSQSAATLRARTTLASAPSTILMPSSISTTATSPPSRCLPRGAKSSRLQSSCPTSRDCAARWS